MSVGWKGRLIMARIIVRCGVLGWFWLVRCRPRLKPRWPRWRGRVGGRGGEAGVGLGRPRGRDGWEGMWWGGMWWGGGGRGVVRWGGYVRWGGRSMVLLGMECWNATSRQHRGEKDKCSPGQIYKRIVMNWAREEKGWKGKGKDHVFSNSETLLCFTLS